MTTPEDGLLPDDSLLPHDGLLAALTQRGVSRRAFLGFCASMAAALALPSAYAPRIVAAVSAAPRLPVVWLRGLGCGGDGEALLRAANPSVGALLLDVLSVVDHEAFMAAAGSGATAGPDRLLEQDRGGYLLVVEGAIPEGDHASDCTVGGRPIVDIVRDAAAGALATIAAGSCASDGGLSAAAGGSTGARGVFDVIRGARAVSLPGCPVNVENLTATIVHFLTFRELPPADGMGRPLFAYGSLIHNQCERRGHFEFGEFATSWGDEGAQKGWCLYRLGCKGPETYANCPAVGYAQGTSWPVKAGHGCVGCTMPRFWDAMLPAYRRLGGPVPFLPDLTADQVGQAMVGAVGALTIGHGAASVVRAKRARRASREVGRPEDVPGEGRVDVPVRTPDHVPEGMPVDTLVGPIESPPEAPGVWQPVEAD